MAPINQCEPEDALAAPAAGPEPRFDDLLEAVPDAIVITDADGHIVLVNHQTEALFGYARAELLGQLIEILVAERFRAIHPVDRAEYREHPRARPMGVGLRLFGRRKDGSEVPVEISLSPMHRQDGLFVISSIRDVTERRKAEEERAELLTQEQAAREAAEAAERRLESLQSVTEAALANLESDELLRELLVRVRAALAVDTAAILLLDSESESLLAKAALGLEEEVRLNVRIPLGKGFAGRIAAERRSLIVEEIDEAEIVNPLLREKGLRSLLGAPLLADGQILGVIHVGTLVPRRFTDEDAQLLQLVADRVAVAIDRARLYQEAQEAVRLRNEFLSAISHDLGNSIASSRTLTRLLQERVRNHEVGDAELLDDLRCMEDAATAAWGLIQELLDLARLQVGRPLDLDWRPVDLVTLVREQTASAQKTAGLHRIQFEPAEPALTGEWDPARLQRVVGNLLSNAIKYSPEGGEIAVRVWREAVNAQGVGRAVIEVQDHGIGIPAVDLPHIFDRFRRASNVVGRFPGTGIGLAGARQIAEQHGGSVSLVSEEGEGTTVSIRLPLYEEAAPAPGLDLQPREQGA